MRIERLEIWNLRGFEHADIPFQDYTCFVGPNGAGKSTVFTALNIFFRQNEYTGTNLQFLDKEDFHKGDASSPIRIRVTFSDLNADAVSTFSHYVRNDRLVITAEAIMQEGAAKAEVKHFGERLVLPAFVPFFKAVSDGEKAVEYNAIYDELKSRFDLPSARSKDDKVTALQAYESARPDECTLERSSDQFYGVSKGTNRLERFIQWVFVPAVKDAIDEQVEAKNGALGRLLARAVRAKSSFEEEMRELRVSAQNQYQKILENNQGTLDEISSSLNLRLADWAHQGAKLRLEWREDEERSIRIEEPWAHVKVGEGAFEGQLARLGHGLQRSYIIALLQELALYDRSESPTLILAIEEPELYQHPPQARHLSDVLVKLAGESAQVLVCSHSPYFVSGYHFENVRLVRRDSGSGISTVTFATAQGISERIAQCTGKAIVHPTGTLARLQQILQPHISEMFFASSIVFVEGREDVAYIKTYLEVNGEWEYLRRLGCHFVPVDKKSELLRPLLVAEAAGIPCFTVFDADGNAKENHKHLHKCDNQQLFLALNIDCDDGFPTATIWGERAVVWPTCMSDEIKASVDPEVWQHCQEQADQAFGHAPTMKKNMMHIAEIVSQLNAKGIRPSPLSELASKLRIFAGRNSGGVDESSGPA